MCIRDSCSTVAAHCRHDKRLQTRLLQALNSRRNNGRQVRKAAAADADGHCLSLLHAVQKAACFERRARGCRHVRDLGRLKMLLDFQ